MITRAHALRVRPFPRVDRRIETARGVRHVGEEGDVRPAQGRACIRLREQVVRLLPLATPCGFARPFHEGRLGRFKHPSPHGGVLDCAYRNGRSSPRSSLRYA
jgi:hypothetical protein